MGVCCNKSEPQNSIVAKPVKENVNNRGYRRRRRAATQLNHNLDFQFPDFNTSKYNNSFTLDVIDEVNS